MHISRSTSSALLFTTFLLTSIPTAASIPHRSRTIESRQSIFASLALPKCALTCFINGLTKDGCKSETDFACHCEGGTVLSEAASCLNKECEDDDRQKAIDQVNGACKAAGADPGDGGDSNSSSSGSAPSSTTGSSTRTSGSSSATGDSSSTSGTSTSPPPTAPPSENPSSPTSAPAPDFSSSNPSASSTSAPLPSDEPPMPSDTPLALLPTDRQLSAGAKAGISVSVTVFASSILLFIVLYIRRLKRELKVAQAAAGVPESVWRAHISTAAAPAPIGRRKSWRGRSGSRTPPGSPGSPMREAGGGDGVLKKKRGHVLSVVVERVEEEDTSSLERMVHEPVPGQKEGLVDPLELDGEYTGIVELPTSITPRTGRSIERGRERGSSLGESSRPSTGDRGRGRW